MTQTLSKTMKAVAIDRFGGIETLETQELPIPAVGADEVLVHVEAAGVGVWDPFEREGGFAKEFNIKPVFPLVLGSDGAGTVEAVGPQVKRLKKGHRVYGISFLNPKGGFYAQYAIVKETSLALIPGKLTMPQAAAMAVDAVTALAGLDTTLSLKNGESLLIFGASGGIGHLAVQFAKRMGARVLAVASGDDGVAFVRGLGADKVVDGYKEDVLAAARQFAPNGLDAVLLTTGGEAAEKSLAALRTGGRVAYPNGVQPVPTERAGKEFRCVAEFLGLNSQLVPSRRVERVELCSRVQNFPPALPQLLGSRDRNRVLSQRAGEIVTGPVAGLDPGRAVENQITKARGFDRPGGAGNRVLTFLLKIPRENRHSRPIRLAVRDRIDDLLDEHVEFARGAQFRRAPPD